jgi:hypothetical protein
MNPPFRVAARSPSLAYQSDNMRTDLYPGNETPGDSRSVQIMDAVMFLAVFASASLV